MASKWDFHTRSNVMTRRKAGRILTRTVNGCSIAGWIICNQPAPAHGCGFYGMAGTDGRLPWDDYRQLLHELGLYDPVLLEKPRLVVANKIDESAAVANLKKFKRRNPRTTVLPISAAFGGGMEQFKQAIRATVEDV